MPHDDDPQRAAERGEAGAVLDGRDEALQRRAEPQVRVERRGFN